MRLLVALLLCVVASMRQFAGLSLARGTVPDKTTILNFRHLLEQHGLTRKIFGEGAIRHQLPNATSYRTRSDLP